MLPFWPLVGLVALLVLSGFFSMSETALLGADRVRIRELAKQGDPRAQRLEHLIEQPERILSTILLGNNIVNIGASALATVIALRFFGDANTGAAVATGVMTFLILVFAEITPKTLAVKMATRVGLLLSGPLRFFHALLRPFAWLLTRIARVLLLPFGIKWDQATPFITQAKIQQMVRMGVEEGEVEHFEHRVITELFDFTETPLVDVMTPVDKVHFLQKDSTLQQALEMSGRTGHSRLPVVDEDFDHVLGFVHAKDLLRFSDQELKEAPATQVLRAVLFVRDDARPDRVLARMQRERKLMSIIQDEHGNNLGIATVEDLLEELVGEIHDEFDSGQPAGPDGTPLGPTATRVVGKRRHPRDT